MLGRLILSVCVFLTISFLVVPSALTQDAHSAQFPGFRTGQSGLGVVLGWPFGVRYQKWQTWKRATFFDLGYQTDGFLVGGANYSFYLFSEDDRWRVKQSVGTILYNLFVGATGAYFLGKDREERARLGLRAGGAFEYLFPASDWAFRAEVAPVFYLSGTTAAGVQAGIVLLRYLGGEKPSPVHKKNNKKREQKSNADEDWDF